MARLRLDSETESGVLQCKAAITSLEKNAETVVSGVQLPLLFTPAQAPGSDAKTIRYGQPEYLELLWIPKSGDEPEIKTNFPFAFSEHQKLDRLATYSFNVAFSAGNIPPEMIVIDAECKSGAWTLSIKRPAEPTDRRLARKRSPAAMKVVDEAMRIKREENIQFTLYALQKAGVGDLDSEEEFSDVRERIIQRGLGDPLAACWITAKEPKWLDFIKFANRNGVQLLSQMAVLDCLNDYYFGESKPPS